MFVSSAFTLETTAMQYHNIDGFRNNEFDCGVELKFEVECGGNIDMKVGQVYSLEAEFGATAYAVWNFTKNGVTNSLECKYQGLYLTIKTKFKTSSDSKNRGGNNNNEEVPEKKFLIHDGFSYEYKLD